MIKKKWIAVFVAMLLTISLLSVSSIAEAQGTPILSSKFEDAGTYYADEAKAANNLLGAAQNFHIFAREVAIKAHTNGNIATQLLTEAGSNFGTNVHAGTSQAAKEYFYIQSFNSMTSNPFVANRPTKFVVGSTVTFSHMNNSEYYLSDNGVTQKIDSLKTDTVFKTVYQEKDSSKPYIDFDKEYKKLISKSTEFYKDKNPTDNIKSGSRTTLSNGVIIDLVDQNKRIIDVTKVDDTITSGYVYINIPVEVITANTPLSVIGLEKEPFIKDLIINVDTAGLGSFNINSQLKLKYKDGTERNPHEAENFQNSTLLWNFYDSTAADKLFAGSMNLANTWQGSILAPKASYTGGQNIDGSIIVEKFAGSTGETHRWDFQGKPTDPADRPTDPGTTPGGGTDPGTTPGGGTDPGTTPGGGTDPGTTPGGGTDPGTTPGGGTDPGTTPGGGTDPGTTPGGGTDPGTTPGGGTDPGTTPGGGTDPGTTPGGGTDPGTTPGGGTDPETTPGGGTDPGTTPEAGMDVGSNTDSGSVPGNNTEVDKDNGNENGRIDTTTDNSNKAPADKKDEEAVQPTLPQTNGASTDLFMTMGVILIAMSAGLLIARRKKQQL